jgi:predicted AAA+ superfamily ATPase
MGQDYEAMIYQIQLNLAWLTIYRNFMDDPIVKAYSHLIGSLENPEPHIGELLGCYHQIFSLLLELYAEDEQATGDLWKYHVIQLLLSDENVFSLACEKGSVGKLSEGLLDIVSLDLKRLHLLFQADGAVLGDLINKRVSINPLPTWEISSYTNTSCCEKTWSYTDNIRNKLYTSANWGSEVDTLADYYYQCGCGVFSQYKAFRWNQKDGTGTLTGVKKPDPIRLSQLIGYERERSEVIQNTLQFIQGLPCNNILLYGDRGTGKSATVKAILNEYAQRKLRLVEVSKYNLNDLPTIMEMLQNRGVKFIIFIDDLSFESDETSYRELKSILEGGIEAKPQNVVIYATSNRRHLVKEYFSERSTGDEIGSQDTMQEKLSLSDRFGITVTFSLPDKETYLQIVEGLARQRCLEIEGDKLRADALKWEMLYNGRSPRTARQFIDHLEGQLKLKD